MSNLSFLDSEDEDDNPYDEDRSRLRAEEARKQRSLGGDDDEDVQHNLDEPDSDDTDSDIPSEDDEDLQKPAARPDPVKPKLPRLGTQRQSATAREDFDKKMERWRMLRAQGKKERAESIAAENKGKTGTDNAATTAVKSWKGRSRPRKYLYNQTQRHPFHPERPAGMNNIEYYRYYWDEKARHAGVRETRTSTK